MTNRSNEKEWDSDHSVDVVNNLYTLITATILLRSARIVNLTTLSRHLRKSA